MAKLTNTTTGALDVPGKGYIGAGKAVDLTADEQKQPTIAAWIKMGMLAAPKAEKKA